MTSLMLFLVAGSALGLSIVPQKLQQTKTSRCTPLNAATALPLDTMPPSPLEAEESKVGVLLLNLGGPETGDDVEGKF